MKKFSKFLFGLALVGSLFANPLSSSAHHGGSSWQTHYTYYSCVHNSGYYKYEQQHRHIGDRQEFRTISTKVSSYCPIM
ncbi:hypothetical protein GCM10008967_32140 [Bacillus carboniphilus]|uniref:Uncharacterized protein n=1 Tax=Bacillus carboniphilus TaxID=86663 RepID=A0ABN0WJ20_9BACI